MEEKTRTPELAAVIRAIRARSGQNQKDFGRTLGVAAATQSRYESGLLTPGHYPLLTLFNLAEGHEKRVIRATLKTALQLDVEPTDKQIAEGIDVAARVFRELARIEATTPTGSRAHRFAVQSLLVANLAAAQPEDAPPECLIELLALWMEYRDTPEAQDLFEDVVGYLRVRLKHREDPS